MMMDIYFMDNKQLEQIRIGLENKVDVSIYEKREFNWEQMMEIRLGLENKVNVSTYAKPEFSWEQMHEIRMGLEENLDISVYTNPEFDWEQMSNIREALLLLRNKSKEDIDILLNIIYKIREKKANK